MTLTYTFVLQKKIFFLLLPDDLLFDEIVYKLFTKQMSNIKKKQQNHIENQKIK